PDSARPHNLALTEYSKKLEDPDRDIGRHPAAGLPLARLPTCSKTIFIAFHDPGSHLTRFSLRAARDYSSLLSNF
ncbi:hypothetical protein P5Z58_10860, partial [Limosilactobacillus mucosae]|nr:hypothetical protein [Limosilactobacillus mucosae]